jgi:PAP2 superfamily protein
MIGFGFPLLLVVVFYHLGETSFLGFAFIGLTAIQLSLAPPLLEMLSTLAVGAAYGFAYYSLGGSLPHDLPFRVAGVLAFVGTGSLMVMAARLLWSPPDMQKQRLEPILTGLTPIAFLAYMPVAMSYLQRTAPDSLDRYLFAFDSRFGFQAGFAMGRLFADWPALSSICSVVYMGLPLAMACVYLAVPRAINEPSLLKTFLVTGILAAVAFRVVPAAGPVYAFTDVYPSQLPAMGADFLRPMHMHDPKLNAIPSLHTAWALLIYWRSRRAKVIVQGVAGAFLFLTLLATLGLGEHYLIDLIVGVPYAVSVRAACMNEAGWSRECVLTAVFNALVVAVWLVLLRQGVLLQVPIGVAWSMGLATVASAIWLNSGLVAVLPKERIPDANLVIS